MRSPVARFGLAAVLVGSVAGCAAPVAPAPAPAPAPIPPPVVSRLPARPAELPLDGLDPCALLTPAQVRQFGLSAQTRTTPESDALGSPACQWTSATRGSAEGRLSRLITERAADYHLDNEKPVQVIDIEGFPAVQTTSPISPSDQDHCLVLVDVAAGQTLWTQYDAWLMNNPGMTQQVSCARAREGAAAMVATLKSLREPGN